ncbi:hypothetical protein HAP48_0004325 [Bradyrhizobium septentrionale]|uniref:Uncharacterized protein n=1 Tax=Bradyrhizobium septentrionale TaxID=1404411 RepID=A0A973W5Q0_9BRAD|nr:hypothetical protein [Bradyrhizobium septentrionale]UGY16773.1 hypothetical protein HAP48_0004325 [Bradyrhizobium septentrionale]
MMEATLRNCLFVLGLFTLIAPAHSAQEKSLLKQDQLRVIPGVDLGIADDETFRRPNSWGDLNSSKTKFASEEKLLPTERLLGGLHSGPASRPGLSIAWRNAAQVEEIEVRVRNLGNQPGEGRVWVDVLGESGNRILRLEPPDELKIIRLPAYGNGGREGKIVRMKSSRELNNIIDQFDRDKRRYHVQATVETIGMKDANIGDNIKTKSWNVPHRVEPKQRNAFNYVYKNVEDKPVRVRWLFERTPYPANWKITGIPASNAPFVVAPGEEIRGALTMDAPQQIEQGAFVEARLSLVNADTGVVWQQREWFQVFDLIPPVVTDYRLVLTDDRRIAIQALVSDQGSGVLEATGVSTQYSTDGGLTWASKAHNYKAGNFVVPTLFEAVLGPFAPGTDVQIRFNAKDTAGNSSSLIPDAATAVLAPKGAEKLIDLATVFPRTQPNAVFTLEPGALDLGQIASRFAAEIATSSNDAAHIESLSTLLKQVPVTEAARTDLMNAARRLSTDSTKTIAAQRFQEVIGDLAISSAQTAEARALPLTKIDAPGSAQLKMSTIGFKIQ